MSRLKLALLLAGVPVVILVAARAGDEAAAREPSLALNRPVELVPVASRTTMFPLTPERQEHARSARGEQYQILGWFDSWFADATGSIWYTPEQYEFAAGDTFAYLVFFYAEGDTARLFRFDAFYPCGESDPLAFVGTSGMIDLGDYPPNQPNYGWIVGQFYAIPPRFPKVQFDAATRLIWGRTEDCGVPLSGRPDCVSIE